MISDIKDATNEYEYGELTSKLGRIFNASAEMWPEIRICNGFALSFNELNRLLEPVSIKVNEILSSEVNVEEKYKQMRELLANHHMPNEMREEILKKYNTLITDLIDKIPKEARHIISGIREKPYVSVRSSSLSQNNISSFSNIIGDEEVIRTLMKSWYCSFSQECLHRVATIDDIKTGIIIQKDLNPDKSGQLITDEALTENRANFTEPEIKLLQDIGNRIQNMCGAPQVIDFGILRGRVFIISCYDKPQQNMDSEDEKEENMEAEETEQTLDAKHHVNKPLNPEVEDMEQESNKPSSTHQQDYVPIEAEEKEEPVSLFNPVNISSQNSSENWINPKKEISEAQKTIRLFYDLFYDLCELADRLNISVEEAYRIMKKEIQEKLESSEGRFFS